MRDAVCSECSGRAGDGQKLLPGAVRVTGGPRMDFCSWDCLLRYGQKYRTGPTWASILERDAHRRLAEKA